MGCITSTSPKKKLNESALRSQTQLMLNRSYSFHEQLRIIIDDDKYKQHIQQNTIKNKEISY